MSWREFKRQVPNNHLHSDSKKRRSFLALLFAASDVRRYTYGGVKTNPYAAGGAQSLLVLAAEGVMALVEVGAMELGVD